MRKCMVALEVFRFRRAVFDWIVKVKIACECGNIFEEEYKLGNQEVVCSKCYSIASGKGMRGRIPSVKGLIFCAELELPKMDEYEDDGTYTRQNQRHHGQIKSKLSSDRQFKQMKMLEPGRFGSFPRWHEDW